MSSLGLGSPRMEVDVESALAKALDQIQICEVRRVWAFSLDLGEWDGLQACFHPDARVTVSWYSGPIGGFIERSKTMAADAKRRSTASIGSATCAAGCARRAACSKPM